MSALLSRACAVGCFLVSGPWLLSGCGDATPPAPKIQVVSGQQHTASGPFAEVAVVCCDTPAAWGVVEPFVAMGTALAADDFAQASGHAGRFAAGLEAHGASLDGPAVSALTNLAPRMSGATSIENLREEFLDASMHVIGIAAAHRGGDHTIAAAFCPMKPGRWLQEAEPLANPYYGASMLRCGTFEPIEAALAQQ